MDKEREAMIESMAKDLYVIDERAIADWVDKYQENYFNMARYLFDIGVRPIEGFEIKEKPLIQTDAKLNHALYQKSINNA